MAKGWPRLRYHHHGSVNRYGLVSATQVVLEGTLIEREIQPSATDLDPNQAPASAVLVEPLNGVVPRSAVSRQTKLQRGVDLRSEAGGVPLRALRLPEWSYRENLQVSQKNAQWCQRGYDTSSPVRLPTIR